MKERRIQVSLTPHHWDNKENPYFWVILEWSGNAWVNSGLCGWESTPQKAWKTAIANS